MAHETPEDCVTVRPYVFTSLGWASCWTAPDGWYYNDSDGRRIVPDSLIELQPGERLEIIVLPEVIEMTGMESPEAWA